MNRSVIKHGSTLLLKIFVVLLGLAVFALCIFILPRIIIAELKGDFDYLPILVGMYIPAIPFFIGLYQGFKLLQYIDSNKVFSNASIEALRKIKICGFFISTFYAVGMPYIFYVAQQDDAPGLAFIGFVFIFASLVVGTAASIFQKQLRKVVDIKSENELTV